VLLTHHTLGDFPGLEGVVESETTDMAMRPDTLDAREVLDLCVNLHVTRRHCATRVEGGDEEGGRAEETRVLRCGVGMCG
jgi:hypothetical protein